MGLNFIIQQLAHSCSLLEDSAIFQGVNLYKEEHHLHTAK